MIRIEATPTTYRGIQFASRLEADWAFMLDSMEIAWQYEPNSYVIGNENYIPDFYLNEQRVWAEVKGPMDDRIEKPRAFQRQLDKSLPEGKLATDPFERELVVILRTANKEVAVWESALPSDYLALAYCPFCRRYAFFNGVEGPSWDCRNCAADLGDCITWDELNRTWWLPGEGLPMWHAPGWRESIDRRRK